MPFEFHAADLKDIILITPTVFGDERGFFLETYKRSDFMRAGIKGTFVQDNHSFSTRGILRGLHYQLPPYGQGKLVRCIMGEIFDVAVDIRKSSKTFGRWIGVILNAGDNNMCYIPPGFAHGYYTMSEGAHVLYKMTAEYAPAYERGIIWNDPQLTIEWPNVEVTLSERDKGHPHLRDAEVFP